MGVLVAGRAASGPATRPPAHGRACAAQVDPPTLRAWVQVRRIWRRLRTLSCLCVLSVCTDCVYFYVYCLCALTVSTSMCTVCVHCLCVLLCVLSCLCVLSSVWQRA
jgi:hypothetical protein